MLAINHDHDRFLQQAKIPPCLSAHFVAWSQMTLAVQNVATMQLGFILG